MISLKKNTTGQKVPIYVWNKSTETPQTGDAGNITAQISIDFGATAATNDTNPTELDATNAPGIYYFNLLQAETNGDLILVIAASVTADVVIEPIVINTLSAVLWKRTA